MQRDAAARGNNAEGRKKLAGYMLRTPMSLEKMTYDPGTGTVIFAEARRAGMAFVVVSPTRADCPAVLDAQWIAIRPNTDAAMLLAMAHVLATENRHHPEFLKTHCSGWEKFEAYLLGRNDGTPKTPEWASQA